MYLLDSIAATAAAVPPGKPHPVLSIFPDLTRRMQHAPRYILDRSATEASVELSLGRPTVFRAALEHIVIPYHSMWIEWAESDREGLRRRIGQDVTDPLCPLPVRVGCLIETEPGGRKGEITWVWTSPGAAAVPNVAPIAAYFDLDAEIVQAADRVEAFKRANLAKLWLDNPIQLDALLSIWRTAIHRPSPWGLHYLNHLARAGGNVEHWLQQAYRDVYGELISAWSILLLLTSSRPSVQYRPVDRAKLNRTRAKRGETLLLDHMEVVMHVAPHTRSGAARAPLGYARKPPRIHVVSNYLARRGTKHWIVNSYIRGSGSSVNRHIHVRN